LAEERERIEDT
jgi:hypothetical protein